MHVFFFSAVALLFCLPLVLRRAINHRGGIAPFRILGSLGFEFIACVSYIAYVHALLGARESRVRARARARVRAFVEYDKLLRWVGAYNATICKAIILQSFPSISTRYAWDLYLLGVTEEMSWITFSITHPISRVRTLRGIFFAAHGIENYPRYIYVGISVLSYWIFYMRYSTIKIARARNANEIGYDNVK